MQPSSPLSDKPEVAYLVNRYPTTSHSFIRREIQALGEIGFAVRRISIRDTAKEFVDQSDCTEYEKTSVVLGSISGWLKDLPRLPYRTTLARAGDAVRLGLDSQRGPVVHLAYLLEAARIAAWCQRNTLHVHAHFGTNSATVALLVHWLTGIPFSFTVHGPEEFDRPTLLSLDTKVAAAKFVACISEYTKGQMCRWCSPQHWHKLQVVRCGLDASILEQIIEPQQADAPLVCVGRLSEQKGFFHLIEALGSLAEAEVRPTVEILGDGPLRSSLEIAIKERGLESTVKLRGWATQAEVVRRLSRAKALILPSLAEGLPVVIMESLALGRPVLATWVGGIPELVQPGTNGWLVPPGDVQALAEAIKTVLETPLPQLERMGGYGRQRVGIRHDVRCEADRLAGHFLLDRDCRHTR